MKTLVENIFDLARLKKVEYVDIRIVDRQMEEIEIKNGNIESITHDEDSGFGIRVLHDGAWGFACSSRVTAPEMESAFSRALRIAKTSGRTRRERIFLDTVPPAIDRYITPVKKNPFEVPIEQKLELLLKADELIRRNKGVKISEAFMGAYRTQKTFASTVGSWIEQEIIECGAGISATAIDSGEVQVRSYPNSFRGNFATQGYEFIEGLVLANHAERVAEEAVQLLSARPCPSRVTTVIIDSSQLALQIHESIGHAIELDRILGMESSYAGTSFVNPEMLGNFRYGSGIINVVADATFPGGLGTFGYDDEGTKAQKFPVITQGILVNVLTSRETCHRIGKKSNGTMRADGWNRIPLIRMTNINLEPGECTLEQLIGETEDGLFLATNRSWSIDDRRMNFQFGTEIGWLIKNGKLGEMVKNPTYTGITPEFWNSCDGIANKEYWQMWGIPNCGKGEPGQVAHVGHGASPARFRSVRVGVMK